MAILPGRTSSAAMPCQDQAYRDDRDKCPVVELLIAFPSLVLIGPCKVIV